MEKCKIITIANYASRSIMDYSADSNAALAYKTFALEVSARG